MFFDIQSQQIAAQQRASRQIKREPAFCGTQLLDLQLPIRRRRMTQIGHGHHDRVRWTDHGGRLASNADERRPQGLVAAQNLAQSSTQRCALERTSELGDQRYIVEMPNWVSLLCEP